MRFIYAFVAVAFVCLVFGLVAFQTDAAAGLTAGYAFDAGAGTVAADASGNGLNGTLTSGATWTAAGKYGSALLLDGVNDHVNLGNPTLLQMTGSMTISAWINSSSFPGDDAAIVSKRGSNGGYQLDTTVDTGLRGIGFKLSDTSGSAMIRYGATAMQTNTWYHVAGVYNSATLTMDVYLNGQPDNGGLLGSITAAQINSSNNVNIGRRAGNEGYEFPGSIDDVRIYNRALSQAEIQLDMNASLGDTTPPVVSMTAPADGATVSGSTTTVSANASDPGGAVAGVQFLLDDAPLGAEDMVAPYSISWNTLSASNGAHTLKARARDGAGNLTTSAPITVTVSNPPVLVISQPAQGAVLTSTTTVNVVYSTTGNLSEADHVHFQLDGGTVLHVPTNGTHQLTGVVGGPHTLTGVVVRADHSPIAGSNASVSFSTTAPDTAPPLVSLTDPVDGAIVSGTISVSADASDPGGAVAGVQFLLDDAPLGAEDTAAPYSISWNTQTAGNGSHSLKARARDSAGNLATSSAVTVTVTSPPTLVISQPTQGAALSSTTTVDVVYSATGNLGEVDHVHLQLDSGTVLHLATNGTHQFTGVPGGPHSLTGVLVRADHSSIAGSNASVSFTTTEPDTAPPLVSISDPSDGSTVLGTIFVAANASDPGGAVAGVQFLLDDAPLGAEDTVAPYSISWNTLSAGNGSHTLKARARDSAGNLATSAAVTVTVSNPPPVVVISQPTQGAVLSSTTTVDVVYSASGNLSAVDHVHLQLDGGTVLHLSTNGTHQFTGVPGGPHTLTGVLVRADHSSIAGSNATVSFSTTEPDTTPPLVSISDPTGGSTVSAVVTVSANASDPGGAVAGVQFLLDGAPLGVEDTAAPYSTTWNTIGTANGSHGLSARARDASGNTTDSALVQVVVSNTQTSGLTAGYAFDEGTGTMAADASGNGLNGTLTNGPTWAAGKYGSAVRLDGVDDYVNLGDPTSLQMTGSMTISAWINSSSFPRDDAAIVSKRGSTGYQLDTTIDTGPRGIGFKLTNTSGDNMIRYGATAMQANTWYHVAGVYNSATLTMDVYLNGQLDNGGLVGPITAAQLNSSQNLNIGRRTGSEGYEFAGSIDDVRIYNRALSQAEIQLDMNATLGDTTPPVVSMTAPANGATVSGSTTTVSADASDPGGAVAGVQFLLDDAPLGAEDTVAPYSISWNTLSASNGSHTLKARARDGAGNVATSAPVTVTVSNPPVLIITQPVQGAVLTSTTTVNVLYTSTGNLSEVDHVHLQLDGGPIVMDIPMDGVHQFTGVPGGTHTLTGVLVRADHSPIAGSNASVSFTTTAPDTTPPLVSITDPADGAIVSGTISISADASDPGGAVAGVQFLLDDAPLGAEDTAAPYSISWNTQTASNGPHTLKARARDSAGNLTTSVVVTVTVSSPPALVISQPAQGAVLSSTTTVDAVYSATGNLSQVDHAHLQLDGGAVQHLPTSGTHQFTGVSGGPHTLSGVLVRADHSPIAGSNASVSFSTTAPDTAPPLVFISEPTGGATVSGIVAVSADASDPGGTVAGVQFLLDDAPLGAEDTVAPYSISWNTLTASNGLHTLKARARDAAGNLATSDPVTVTVSNPPVLVINQPAQGAVLSSTTTVNVLYSTTGNLSEVDHVHFQLDGGPVVMDIPMDGAYQFTGVSGGFHTLTGVLVRADHSSIPGSNASVSFTTTVPDTTPPQVSISAPSDGSIVSAVVTVSADASDPGGAVAGVQFLLDGAPLGAEDTAAPYSTTWNTISTANGSHELSARARDASGNTRDAALVQVFVSNTQTAGLTAGYAFDEGTGTVASDAAGNGLNGTLTNGATWAVGKYGSAVRLDGVDDHVNLGNPASLQMTGSMTISAWINSSSFPGDDAAIVSERSSLGYQLDTTVDMGARGIGFKLTNSSGDNMFRYGATAMQTNAWYHVAGVYNSATLTLNVYLNGQLDNGALVGSITAAQFNSNQNVNIGRRTGSAGYEFAGSIDDVRIYNRALTQGEIQTDMNTPINGTPLPPDSNPPQSTLTFPQNNAQVSGIITLTADATDDRGVAGVQFLLDGVDLGPEDSEPPYAFSWDSRTVSNGSHTFSARARDTSGNTTLSAAITATVSNLDFFQNEILTTGLNLPTNIEFLPDGRMLIVELGGKIWILPPGATEVDPVPFLHLTNIGSLNSQQGIMDIVLDPDFATNNFYYLFYTLGSPNRDRLSRFTANGSTTVPGSEVVLWQDVVDAHAEHHGGALNFGNDGKLYFTTGEHFNASDAQNLSSYHGKILRINKDGTIPADNPFHDGAGPNQDAIWALGLRNPFRAYIDPVTGRFYIADVGGNDYSTAIEEVNLGVAGANYGWPNCEGACGDPAFTGPIYSYHHNGRDASITGGFIYRGTQFPSEYHGNYFFADYTQNWIRRLTLDAAGNVTGVFNFEPMDGAEDGPYGDIVHLTQGPDGSLYYTDLGYSDVGGIFGLSKIRRIRYVQNNQPPIAVAAANPTQGPVPLTVNFSSAGSSDPEGGTLTYLWTFGDSTTSTEANPAHTYSQAGQYTVRLSVSDGVTSTLAAPLSVSVGSRPTGSILTPQNGIFFRAGDVIGYSGDGADAEDGVLPASAFSWQINFHHSTHIHPGLPVSNTKTGSFQIPTSGHDFSGNTRYEIVLTLTDSDGLQATQSVFVFPDKVNLTFDSQPTGLTLRMDGIARTAPFVHDTLIGFNHTIDAPNQSQGTTTYTFGSWSDGGAQEHVIAAPGASQSYVAVFNAGQATLPAGLAAAFGFNEASGTSAADGSGNGNTASLLNGVSRTAGHYGNGLTFDGVDDYLSIANSASVDISGNGFTLSMWINPQPLGGGDSVVLGKFWNSSMTSPYYQYGLELSGGTEPYFYVGTNSGFLIAPMGSNLVYNQWTHLAVVFDGVQVRFYQNGTLVSTQPLAASLQARGNPIHVGADIGPLQFHKGSLDELRIYNRALNASEILTDMNTPF